MHWLSFTFMYKPKYSSKRNKKNNTVFLKTKDLEGILRQDFFYDKPDMLQTSQFTVTLWKFTRTPFKRYTKTKAFLKRNSSSSHAINHKKGTGFACSCLYIM